MAASILNGLNTPVKHTMKLFFKLLGSTSCLRVLTYLVKRLFFFKSVAR